jgi:hypothetical protein
MGNTLLGYSGLAHGDGEQLFGSPFLVAADTR